MNSTTNIQPMECTSTTTMTSIMPPPTKLNNYDVILHHHTDTEPLQVARGTRHVGNGRFRIMMESLFRQRYLQAELFGDDEECISIAQEVIDTVCFQCSPNGRFFVLQKDCKTLQQIPCNSPLILGMIQNALQKYPVEERRADVLFSPPKKRQTTAEYPPSRGKSGLELLSRAASSKELLTQELVDTPSRFDVVCTARGISHDRQFTGNNRLKVMFTLRSDYNSSTQEERQLIVESMVSSVMDDAGGKFLQIDKESSKYKVLSRSCAATCIRKALDSSNRKGSTSEKNKKHRDAELKKLMQRKQRKDILDKLAKKRGSGGLFSSSGSPPPTTFKVMVKQNSIRAKAA